MTPAGPVFRLARSPDPWAWPDWSQAGQDGTFGSRWDDPLGSYRVLYASATRFGALIETLSPFRPDLEVAAGLREIEGSDEPVAVGTVPREWFERRLMGVAELAGTYADIGAAASLSVLRSHLADRGMHHGLPDIDGAAIPLTAPRGFTQEVSRLVYECRTEGGEPLAGIRYQSRLDDGTSNWGHLRTGGGHARAFAFVQYRSGPARRSRCNSRTRRTGPANRVTSVARVAVHGPPATATP